MGGGLMQLVAYGAQDIYLTGNPQITFFKVVYRRHTNFAVESIEQTFNGSPDFGKRVTATISRNGDLIQQMYIEVALPAVDLGDEGIAPTAYWTYGVGNALVKQAEIEIGGQLIDRHYGEWMNIWTELCTPEGKRAGYDDMVGNTTSDLDQTGGLLADGTTDKLYIPFQFWFNRNPGLALPLIALQYHEVKLNLEFRNWNELINGNIVTQANRISLNGDFKLFVDYVYLDTDERRRFAQVSHEYLIEQIQFTGDESIMTADNNKNVVLNFNHPVKELIWVHISSTHSTVSNTGDGNKWFNFGLNTVNETQSVINGVLNPTIQLLPPAALPVADSTSATTITQNLAANNADTFNWAKLQLNGHDRFAARSATYFRKVQNYEHHSRVPRTPTITAGGYGLVADTTTVTTTVVQTTTNGNTYNDPGLTIENNGTTNVITGVGLDKQSVQVLINPTINTAQVLTDGTNVTTTNVNVPDNQELIISKNNNTDPLNVITANRTIFSSESVSESATRVYTKATANANLCQYIYTYSFALSPEEHQPSGTCNFSRIDNAVLQLDYTGKTGAKNLKVFAINYNVLRIMSGMGGLAYSN